MIWQTKFNDAYWKIESTYLNVDGDLFYFRWEKNFIKITCKIVVTQSVIVVNGVSYQFFNNNEVSIIEISDDVRSNDTGVFYFNKPTNELISQINYMATNGEFYTDAKYESIPSEIPYKLTGVSPDFFVQYLKNLTITTSTNVYNAYTEGIFGFDTNVKSYAGVLKSLNHNAGEMSYFTNLICEKGMLLVEWVGRFGAKKSWWFKIEREISSTSKQLALQTLDSGYNVLKNKRKAVQIIHRKADHTTQQYLSDLVLSDTVYVYSGTEKIQVDVDTNSFEVVEKKRDIQILINLTAYDTI